MTHIQSERNARHPNILGTRKITPGLIAAKAMAEEVQNRAAPMPPKPVLFEAVRFLAAEGRISLQQANMLDVLIDFCGTLDEGHPIVFASNQALADRLRLKERAVRARLANLGALGLIWHEDRADRRRGVSRDPITGERRYYGISLAPLIARLDEIDMRAAAHKETCNRARIARSAVAAGSTRIRSLYGAALEMGGSPEEWLGRLEMAEDLRDLARSCDDVSDLEAYAETMAQARAEAEAAIDALAVDECREFAAYPANGLPPITINRTLTDKSEHCSQSDDGAADAARHSEPRILRGKKKGLEDEKRSAEPGQAEIKGTAQSKPGAKKRAAMAEIVQSELARYRITPDDLCELSEVLQAFLDLGALENPTWGDCAKAADLARSHIGLSEPGWREVVENIGPQGAIAALAFATSDASEIKNPPAYIRNLARLAEAGTPLDIGRKLRKTARLKAEGQRMRRPN